MTEEQDKVYILTYFEELEFSSESNVGIGSDNVASMVICARFSVAYKRAEGMNNEYARFSTHEITCLKVHKGGLVVCIKPDCRKLSFDKSSSLSTLLVKSCAKQDIRKRNIFHFTYKKSEDSQARYWFLCMNLRKMLLF